MLSLFLLTAAGLCLVYPDVVGVVVVKAGGAVVFAFAGTFLHTFDAQVAKAFDAEHLGDFGRRHGACGKFALARKIHAEEARVCHRRRCNTDMHF